MRETESQRLRESDWSGEIEREYRVGMDLVGGLGPPWTKKKKNNLVIYNTLSLANPYQAHPTQP